MRHVRRPEAGSAHAKAIRRIWRVARSVALVAFTLSLGVGGGTAWAYFSGTGSGSGHATTGSTVAVTITATGGSADLLPGGTGAVYFTLHNTNSLSATFNQVAMGATVVSNDNSACPSGFLSIGQTLPYAFSPAVVVGANATSGIQSIADLVALANTAPSSCQNVTFTVTLTLEGKST